LDNVRFDNIPKILIALTLIKIRFELNLFTQENW